MKLLLKTIILLIIISPVWARPFDYNLSLGPEYWSITSHKANTDSHLVTGGFMFRGNLFSKVNAEFRGGTGEIATTRISFNEISLLYNAIYTPTYYLGCGISYLTYNNILSKASNTAINQSKLNAKIQWQQSFSGLWGFYLKLVGPNMIGYDLGWIAYFDKDLGDFNIHAGYKNVSLSGDSSMQGIYMASEVYF